jgi:hypothetical protein
MNWSTFHIYVCTLMEVVEGFLREGLAPVETMINEMEIMYPLCLMAYRTLAH